MASAFILLLLFTVSLCFHPNFAINQEGLYLLRVKDSLSDPAGSLNNWSDRDATPCNWTGIVCDNRNSVVSVNLTGASLSGPFPMFVCRLPSLSMISLSNNSINSSLPVTISSCRNLTYLDLSDNLFVGTIPYSLADIHSLRYINFEANNFSGEIPESFGNFRLLETFKINENLLNGTVPAALGRITSLKSLELAYNPFSPGRLPPELGNLTNLEVLWLSHCHLEGPIPESFVGLSRIKNLDLSGNRLTGPIPSLICKLKSVVQIELYANLFTGKLPAGWSNLTELRRFDAAMNNLTGTIPDELCELPLEWLNLYENQLNGQIPESIAKSPNLYDLRLFGNQLSGSLPSELGKNSALQTLDVSHNNLSGVIPEHLCQRGVLEELVLIYNSFSGNIPESLGKCRSLMRIRMRGNRLSGEIPADFWGLPHVYLLDLDSNAFSGNISNKIFGARNLSTLSVSENMLSGSIPRETGSLENLVEFSAHDNHLGGEIPSSLVHLGQLGKLDLSNNHLSGEIPRGVKDLKQLNELNLANNRLYGEIPDEIGSMPVLNYLDLSRNTFSGSIPRSLQNLKLNMLNLSNNQLSGEVPPLFAKEVYRDSFLGNPGLCGNIAGLCNPTGENRSRAFLWVLRSIFVIAGIVFLVGVVCFVWKYKNAKKMNKGVIMTKWTSFHKLGFSEFEISECLKEANVIGRGASGKVYKVVLSNGEIVAVKKLWERSDKIEDEFEIEVETLGKVRHKNIVKLWCSCNTGSCKLLVYEYMPNGSLGDLLHINKSKLLNWRTRFKIVLDAAEGLSYLHHDCVPSIVHRDVKSNNILLDENFGAKISDFGVAKILKTVNRGVESMSVIVGSRGYIAPEYAYTLRVNEKSDIYSFGIVILELVTGRTPTDPDFGGKDLATWVCMTLDKEGIDHVMDPSLDSEFKEQICRLLDIGLLCTSSLPINRPSMRTVVKMLQALANNMPNVVDMDGKTFPSCDQESMV
ncbi:receptor-like protein kinase HSL1 [Olea europaea var. sylvestris]|uniref:receptor-like protein kinase HSL1 n=1 Tax=Olea europaea var. sylvestris TaxID=158386 RepID=UPI000C1D1DA6|nr:receptor-like protein kinase HSL1 [Olea europaea var. sylvestris]XP_022877223.1 receptor-like protein kinase HSL1 [Olea europaea var. sylvestris]